MSSHTARLDSAPAAAVAPNRTATLFLNLLTLATIIGVAVSLYMGLFSAGTDIEQGNVQRLFYIHVPSFAGAFIALGATVIGGIAYLRTRHPRWDTFALAGVEVGLALVNLVTGSVWARPIWNTWWNWDPRLTADAIMILTYAAYLMLRGGIENIEQRRRFASVYGILAFSTVLITFLIIRIRPDTIHPVVFGPVLTDASMMATQGDFELNATPGVTSAVGFASAVWSILVPWALMWHRIRLENIAERVNALRAHVMEQ
ncbi:MAG: cytochrome c biogenesis protein CcsA [bacterium]|nr:cytochrome c biogenesis protein CcsA [bacterium]